MNKQLRRGLLALTFVGAISPGLRTRDGIEVDSLDAWAALR